MALNKWLSILCNHYNEKSYRILSAKCIKKEEEKAGNNFTVITHFHLKHYGCDTLMR